MEETRQKIYPQDDAFKRKARAHQFDYRDKVLGVTYDAKNPQVMLTPDAAKLGLNFYERYRDEIRKEMGQFDDNALCANMLRSEHIPYNVFTPMKLDLEQAAALFNRLIGGGITRITEVLIEFAGIDYRQHYLNDHTSFDAYIAYDATDGTKGGIGIEVKYTERGYPLGVQEGKNLKDQKHPYHTITRASGYLKDDCHIEDFAKQNHLRQIWRNHMLGYSMMNNGDIQRFHHIHFYPAGNTHFSEHALPEYRQLLTDKGAESFIELTYEALFDLMKQYFITNDQQAWIDYLEKRYLVH